MLPLAGSISTLYPVSAHLMSYSSGLSSKPSSSTAIMICNVAQACPRIVYHEEDYYVSNDIIKRTSYLTPLGYHRISCVQWF
jgi:hypothetical protein